MDLEKLMTISHKHNLRMLEDGGEMRVLTFLLNEGLTDDERTSFFADTFGMFDTEVDALHEACRDLTDDEIDDEINEERIAIKEEREHYADYSDQVEGE